MRSCSIPFPAVLSRIRYSNNQSLAQAISRKKWVLISSRSNSTRLSADSSFEKQVAESNLVRSGRLLKWYTSILHICTFKGLLNLGREVHGCMLKTGLELDLPLWVSLLNFYSRCGSFRDAFQVFDVIPERDVVSWTALISGLVVKGYELDGLDVYRQMLEDGVRPNDFTLSTVLKACSSSSDLDLGMQLHSEVVKFGFLNHKFVGCGLVEVYVTCGEMGLAEKMFSYLPEKNVVLWNVLLNGYIRVGDEGKVIELLRWMNESEVRNSKYTLSSVLKVCGDSENLRGGQIVHCIAVKIGCELDEFLACCLLDMYAKCGSDVDALNMFRRIPEPSVIAWSVIINCLDRQGMSEEAAEMFNSMRQTSLRPKKHVFGSAIGAASNLGNLYYCEGIHACTFKYGFESDNFISSMLIAMYMKIGCPQKGWQVFEAITSHDLGSWTALLTGMNENEVYHQGPGIFRKMLEEGFRPDVYAFTGILKSCSSLLNANLGKQTHSHIIKSGFARNNLVGASLVDMYARADCLEFAEVIFNDLTQRESMSWTAIISGYAQTEQGEKAINCFNQMLKEGLKPNSYTLSSSLSGCSNLKLLESGRQLHAMAIKSGLVSDTYVGNSLVGMYVKCRCIEEAEAVFKNISSRDIVLWNTVICGYAQHGHGKKALETFQVMINEGAVPDEVTFVGVLSACSHMGLIEEGKRLFHSLSEVYKITPAIEHCAIMAKLLYQEGNFSKVEEFIAKNNITLNPVIWETILSACKRNSHVMFGEKAARRLFQLEPESGYNYILLSHIFASVERWDDAVKIRSLMSDQGIRKLPACSWVEVDAQLHLFFAQDDSQARTREISEQLEKLARCDNSSWYSILDPCIHHLSYNVG